MRKQRASLRYVPEGEIPMQTETPEVYPASGMSTSCKYTPIYDFQRVCLEKGGGEGMEGARKRTSISVRQYTLKGILTDLPSICFTNPGRSGYTASQSSQRQATLDEVGPDVPGGGLMMSCEVNLTVASLFPL